MQEKAEVQTSCLPLTSQKALRRKARKGPQAGQEGRPRRKGRREGEAKIMRRTQIMRRELHPSRTPRKALEEGKAPKESAPPSPASTAAQSPLGRQSILPATALCKDNLHRQGHPRARIGTSEQALKASPVRTGRAHQRIYRSRPAFAFKDPRQLCEGDAILCGFSGLYHRRCLSRMGHGRAEARPRRDVFDLSPSTGKCAPASSLSWQNSRRVTRVACSDKCYSSPTDNTNVNMGIPVCRRGFSA